jgi:DNA-binding transcriptional MerR regulator
MKDANLSPAETARLLGLSIKALRLYEERGLVTPMRTAADWRVYGPAQLARLHQIVALKRLGLPLARIGELLGGEPNALDRVLDLQERVLAREGVRVARALEIVRTARAKLLSGQDLSIDDLATLTKETTMTKKASVEEMRPSSIPSPRNTSPPKSAPRCASAASTKPKLPGTGRL